MNIAVMISGSGSTLQNLIDLINDDELPLRIVGVLSSKADAYGLQRAAKHDIPISTIERKKFKGDQEGFSNAITESLLSWSPELVVMAGFIHLYKLPSEFEGRIVNIHPALLPNFGGKGMYGLNVHKAVLDSGQTESGCTVHWVDNQYDNGPIIDQSSVAVQPDDTPATLQERVQTAERSLYPRILRSIAESKIAYPGHR